MLAVDHTDHQRHQVILFRSWIRGQHQRLLRQRGNAAFHLQLLAGTPGVNAVRIVIQQLPLQALQRVRIGRGP